MTTRTKTTAGITSRPQFEHEVDCIAQMQVSLQTLEAERTAQLNVVEENFGKQIADLEKSIKASLKSCATFAVAHRAELFDGDLKSSSTPLATFGFRDGQPHLDTLSKWTWEKVLKALVEHKLFEFIRQKPEVDKEVLLVAVKNAPNEKKPFDFARVGVKLAQEESFYISPKADDADRSTAKPGHGKAGA